MKDLLRVVSSYCNQNYLLNKCFLWFIFFILALNVFLFTYYNSIPYVKADGWRFVDSFLVPWSEGGLSFSDLFNKEAHPQPLTASLFILNAELFGLRMDYEGILGVIFAILSSYVLLRKLQLSEIDRFSMIAIAVVMMSLVSTNVYTWSLVTIGYIQGLISLLMIFYIDNISKATYKLRDLSILAFCLLLYFFIFGDGAKLIIASVVGVLIVAAVFERNIDYLKIIAVIFIIYVINTQIYQALGVGGINAGKIPDGILETIFTHQYEFLRYVGIGLLSACVNIAVISKYFNLSIIAIEITGLVVLALYVLTCFLYYRTKIYEKTRAPVVLIGMGLLTAIAGWIFRYNPEVQEPISANVPRYYTMYSFGLVGVIWVWAEYIKLRINNMRFIVMAVLLVLIGSHLSATLAGWTSSKYVRMGVVRAIDTMIAHGEGDYSDALPRFVTGSNFPEPYKKDIKYLKENKLNVFMDDGFVQDYRR